MPIFDVATFDGVANVVDFSRSHGVILVLACICLGI